MWSETIGSDLSGFLLLWANSESPTQQQPGSAQEQGPQWESLWGNYCRWGSLQQFYLLGEVVRAGGERHLTNHGIYACFSERKVPDGMLFKKKKSLQLQPAMWTIYLKVPQMPRMLELNSHYLKMICTNTQYLLIMCSN